MMDPRDFFKGFFGFGNFGRDFTRPFDRELGPENENLQRPPFPEDDGADRGPNFHVEVFTNPLEMHKFFDEQMDQMIKSFFGPAFGGLGRPPVGGSEPTSPFPGMILPEPRGQPPTEGETGSRDFMLKDGGMGYTEAEKDRRLDSDLDGQVNVNELFKDKPSKPQSPMPVVPYGPESFNRPSWLAPFFEMPRSNEFGQSSQSFSFSSSERTIRNPDGTLRREITQRSSDGSETTTIIESQGDQTRTVTTIRKPDGTEEKQEHSSALDSWNPGLDDGSGRQWGMLRDKEKDRSIFSKFFGW